MKDAVRLRGYEPITTNKTKQSSEFSAPKEGENGLQGKERNFQSIAKIPKGGSRSAAGARFQGRENSNPGLSVEW